MIMNPMCLLHEAVHTSSSHNHKSIRIEYNMNDFQTLVIQLITNRVLVATGAAWTIAQVMKIIIDMVTGHFTPDRLTGSGGMPSSHTATVVALAISTGIVESFASTSFVIAFFLATIVIYDATGVRAEAGKHAHVLNQILLREDKNAKPLEEKIGHTGPEIIAGAIIGFAVACIVCNVIYPAILG
jgi:acid phosphatase family membrane protein YuiD